MRFSFSPSLLWLNWLRHYRRADLAGDVIAGIIVTIMLVPQSMAYAQLAGLPPQAGLYASIVPLIIYGLLGSSRMLAVGPVAIVSLLVVSGLSPLAQPGSPPYIQLALNLALLVEMVECADDLFDLLSCGILELDAGQCVHEHVGELLAGTMDLGDDAGFVRGDFPVTLVQIFQLGEQVFQGGLFCCDPFAGQVVLRQRRDQSGECLKGLPGSAGDGGQLSYL